MPTTICAPERVPTVSTAIAQPAVSELPPRVVLLAGSARGGTSWVLKTLDSHPMTCGCHEPFYQLWRDAELQQVLERLKRSEGTPDDVRRFFEEAIRGRVQTHKPPFFRKAFLFSPAWLQTAAWTAARSVPALEPLFRRIATGKLDGRHCLIIKNRPFPLLEQTLRSINADALLLLRHPCGVVSSWLRGIQMGIMDGDITNPASMWSRYSVQLTSLGFGEQEIRSFSETALLAVSWLLDTQLFRLYETIGMKTLRIVYEDLAGDPKREWPRVFDWLGLSFDDAVQRFLSNSSRPKLNLRSLLGRKYAYFSVQRGKRSPLEAWKQDLTSAQIREVLDIVTPRFPIAEYWS